jgi:tetratricopeptide (TPR) repeat protein
MASDAFFPFRDGVEVGFLLSAHETGTAEWVNQGVVESEIDVDVTDAYKETSFGINVGAGLSFPAGSGSFFLEARYALGECFFFRRRYREAISEYRYAAASDLSPSRRLRLLTRTGWSWSWLGETDHARKAFQEARAIRPGYPPAQYGLGVIEYRAGRKGPAREALNNFLRLEGEGRRARKARALLSKLGVSRSSRADGN